METLTRKESRPSKEIAKTEGGGRTSGRRSQFWLRERDYIERK